MLKAFISDHTVSSVRVLGEGETKKVRVTPVKNGMPMSAALQSPAGREVQIDNAGSARWRFTVTFASGREKIVSRRIPPKEGQLMLF